VTDWGLSDVTVDLGGARPALDAVDLPIARGTVTAVVGGDGAGKSTVVRALTGRVVAAAGEVRVPPAHHVGAVLHASGVYGDLTVDENLAFVADAYGVPPDQRPDRLAALVGRAGLDGARDRLAAHLSGGMRQKLTVICAMVPAPELVVLDEPTTGVDPVSRAELWRLLAGAAAHGTAIVMTTTYLDEAERAGHLLVLDRGRTVVTGAPPDVVGGHRGATLVVTDHRVDASSWRHGRRWRTWCATPPPGADRPTPTLEDVVIRAQQHGVEGAEVPA
jgi:ABC-2 type transport system ATP-binding protein